MPLLKWWGACVVVMGRLHKTGGVVIKVDTILKKSISIFKKKRKKEKRCHIFEVASIVVSLTYVTGIVVIIGIVN